MVHFFAAMGANPEITIEDAVDWLEANWEPTFLPYFIEAFRLNQDARSRRALTRLLKEKTPRDVSADPFSLGPYIWEQDIENTAGYAVFKQLLLRQIDPRFERYFEPDRRFEIHLDEVLWGGVVQDGIPPLRNPKMVSKEAADGFLRDAHTVFGIEVNGEAYAYPKRILAWHEMFTDTIAGVPLAGVYCTLCGTVILYETLVDGVQHELGTSGFLYRSNKLMYDAATQSLWSTLEGRPVIGPLAGSGIELPVRSVVTTTWGAWKARHPETRVLSLETGYDRDYDEGIAYYDYFATDALMFPTPTEDNRLANKDEVLVLRSLLPEAGPVAIAERFLRKNPVYEMDFEGHVLLILTDQGGANRVYRRPPDLHFADWDRQTRLRDQNGDVWTLNEAALETADGRILERLPAHRAFWFGWVAAYPETILIR